MNRNVIFYTIVLLLFGSGIFFILHSGSSLEEGRKVAQEATKSSPSSATAETLPSSTAKIFQDHLREPLSILLLQIIVILVAARVLGRWFVKLGQPAVIGEMLAGIMLGPSLLGLISGGALEFLFPAPSMVTLRLFSQVGVILFMFVVGMDFDMQHLREKAHTAVIVSHASIIVPFFLGATLSLIIYRPFAPDSISFTPFALFMGIAMSITAFPVLARIIAERGMTKTPLGNLTIACAAVDDVTAWCILALVVAIVKAQGVGASLLTICMALLFTGLMIFVIRPWLGRRSKEKSEREDWSKGQIAGVLASVLICAWLTEMIGIHALFGAFLAGIVMPSSAGFRSFLRDRLEPLISSAFLPLFFAFTGLRTQVGLLDDWGSWFLCLGIISVAVAGKFGGSMLAARWTGMNWQDSLSIGALMNTRGLVELIVLNIGYDLGILPPRIFAIMVLMALITTGMTGPLLSLIKLQERRNRKIPRVISLPGKPVREPI
ncbi:MAG: cation:proton antiporter [Acidobacteria bacterium]|nr:cation:proton antiporter [Acidobacteriota bacterium]